MDMVGGPISELDAHPVDESPRPRVRLMLAPTSGTLTPVQELVIVDETMDGSEMEVRLEQEGVPTDHRHFHPEEDTLIPMYTIAQPNQEVWHLELGYNRGCKLISYTLRQRQDVYELQSVMTGFLPTIAFQNVSCAVVIRSGVRRSRYEGVGEVQLWQPQMLRRHPAGASQPPKTSAGSSRVHGSVSEPDTVMSRVLTTTGATAMHHDTRTDRHVLQSGLPSPPLLVAFLKKKKDQSSYQMLRLEVSDLKVATRGMGLELRHESNSTFVFKQLTIVNERDLGRWNLLALNGRSSGVEEKKATHLALSFQAQRDSDGCVIATAEEQEHEFERHLCLLQSQRLALQRENRSTQQLADRTPESFTTGRRPSAAPPGIPSVAAALYPTRSWDTPQSSRYVGPEAARRPSANSLPSLPVTALAGNLTSEVLAELQHDREPGEVDGTNGRRQPAAY
jgi:hypothetical protein